MIALPKPPNSQPQERSHTLQIPNLKSDRTPHTLKFQTSRAIAPLPIPQIPNISKLLES
ncbi:hypothetical protein [Nostoc sp. CENA543]|uniref:hypothetical protein n=1 Tax=Nostoc sp. CENA543 TaxID=1869241 RepID=UPI0012FFEEBC|nr:hypothetical protein [Nostoc sp. CENA543]